MSCLAGSAWWEDPLANDIHSVLKAKEKNIPTYYGLSPHISARKFLVDWLALIREKLHLQETTYHLAVFLLDYFMEEASSVKYEQLHLVALSSLVIAAKLEESCDRVPSVSVLNSFIPVPQKPELPAFYCRSEYKNMELTLLKHFQWNIMKPTTAHFLSYYMSCSVFQDDLHNGMPIQSADTLRTCLESYKDYFQDVSLQYPVFRSYPPSVVAAACLATSRLCIHLTPMWPPRLHTLTGCCLEELLPCIHSLLRVHNKDLAEDEGDS